MAKWTYWTTPEVEIVKQEYKGKSPAQSCKRALKEKLNSERSLFAIQHKAKEFGLQIVSLASFPRNGKDWTEKEDEFLIKNRQRYSLYYCSEKLKRSLAAINWRCSFLHINGEGRDGWYTLSEASGILGIHVSLLRKIVKDGMLVAKRRNPNVKESDWEITEDGLYDFMTQYPMFLQNRHCDMVQVIDILTKGGIKYKV